MALDKNGKPLPKGITYREKEARYMGRFMYHGEAFTTYGKTLRETQKNLEKLKSEVMQGIYFKEDSVTFDVWFEIWIRDYKDPCVKRTTTDIYKRNYNTHIRNVFGSKQMRDIRTDQIQRFYNIKSRSHSHSTLETCRTVLNGMYTQAIRNEIIQKNPVSNAVLPRDNKRHTANVMTLNEQQLFLKYAKNTRHYPLYELALSTGMRSGEVRGLQWTDVDFQKKKIYITHTLIYLDGEYRLSSPKTISSERDIPMLDNVYSLLKEQRKNQLEERIRMGNLWNPKEGLENLVFTNSEGRPINRDRFKKGIDQVVKRITNDGISFPHITPHTFRHTFATRSIERGIQPKALQTILGHNDLSTTMDTYAHVLPDAKTSEMQKLIGLFG